MDQIQTTTFNPHLRKVLKSFQTASMSSLNGPSSYMSTWGETSKFPPTEEELKKAVMAMKKTPPEKCIEIDPLLAPPPYPVQQMPILAQPDQGRSERSETILEGEAISCFIVGGEKRLCLPQILNSVLRDFSLQQINSVCDDLHIFCSRCNPEQLEILKVMGILPFTAPSCGLITKTDAERLCNALLYSNPPKASPNHPPYEKSFLVYHECFGKCKGIFDPELYVHPFARCIQCTDCNGLFVPEKFVCHAHKALENRICHWGFDSLNWRAYLLLAKDQQNTQDLQDRLDEIKCRFDYSNKYKRKQIEGEAGCKSKKARYDDSWYPYSQFDPMGWSYWYSQTKWGLSSTFRPWDTIYMKDGKTLAPPPPLLRPDSVQRVIPPTYLSHGPPVLLNPERVVPLSESERFERHYQPNVALAPASAQRSIPTNTCIATITPNTSNSAPSSTCQTARVITDLRSDSTTDTSTDSEDFSTDSASSHDMGGSSKIENSIVLPIDCSEVNVEHEVDAIKGLLDSSGLGKETKEKILHEIAKMRLKQEEKISNAVMAKKSLQQEVEFLRVAKREKLREEAEARRMLRKEITRQRTDFERRMHKLKRESDLRNKRFNPEISRNPQIKFPVRTVGMCSEMVIVKQEKFDELLEQPMTDESMVT